MLRTASATGWFDGVCSRIAACWQILTQRPENPRTIERLHRSPHAWQTPDVMLLDLERPTRRMATPVSKSTDDSLIGDITRASQEDVERAILSVRRRRYSAAAQALEPEAVATPPAAVALPAKRKSRKRSVTAA